MRTFLILLLWPAFAFSQSVIEKQKLDAFKTCKTKDCELRQSIRLSEFYVEADYMQQAQEWLDHAKKLHQRQPKDSISYFINSLQSEIFYYMELYQFGLHEAEKGIERANIIKDSAFLSDAYFFKGINQIEMKMPDEAQINLLQAEKYHPKKAKAHIRTIIGKAYIYNNLAQIKLQIKQPDSAVFYNKKSYALAMANKNSRGIANSEQTFGLIYAEQHRPDSAAIYLKRSLDSAIRYGLDDVAAINCSYLMKIDASDGEKVWEYYQKGLRIIADKEVNNTYQRYFFETALDVLKRSGNQQQVMLLQDKIIAVNNETNHRANYYLESIMERYMTNENKLLTSRINELGQERNVRIFQLLAALFGFLVLLFVALFFRRKNRLQRLLLDQKNEISKDLHDDIGIELSSIMINTNLLRMADNAEKKQFLIDKISHTTTEISQRLNAFIWSLNNDNDTVGNFAEYVKYYTEKLLEGSAISVIVTDNISSESHKILNGYFRKNLFFCVKEALNNAIKHSGATAVTISIASREKSGLQIQVSDNGNGNGQQTPFGNGISNIRKRVASLKGNVTFTNENGLKVLISVPFPQQ